MDRRDARLAAQEPARRLSGAPEPFAGASPELAALRDAYAVRRRRRMAGRAVAVLLFLACFFAAAEATRLFEVVRVGDDYRLNLIVGLPRLGEFLAKTVPPLAWDSLGTDLAVWLAPWRTWLELLRETLLIAAVATLLASAAGLALGVIAARNLAPGSAAGWTARRCLEVSRTVPDLVWALIFVYAFGAGPLAGVLALGLHATGALGKLFAEVLENIDIRPVESVRATGARWVEQVSYGALPQAAPMLLSYALLRFEINVRASTIIGFVGAGGLGQEIRTAISLQTYTDLSALFLIILATVVVIDMTCERLRHAIAGPVRPA